MHNGLTLLYVIGMAEPEARPLDDHRLKRHRTLVVDQVVERLLPGVAIRA